MEELNESLFVFFNSYKNDSLDFFMPLASSYATIALTLFIVCYYSFKYFKTTYSSNPVRLTFLLIISTMFFCVLTIFPLFFIFPKLIDMPQPYLNPRLASVVDFENMDYGSITGPFPFRPFIITYFTTILFCVFEFRFKRPFLILAALSLIVAYSRIYVGAQYPLNVLLSVLFGIIIGFISSVPHFVLFIIGTEEKRHF